MLFHHRFPTSTSNVRNACHPFSTKDFYRHNYVLVHNGVLWNDYELKREHDKLGIKYVSEANGKFNDSEALTHDVARYLEGEVDKLTARGSIAFICIQRDKDGAAKALYFGRNSGNPLKMKLTDNSITLSSEGDGEMIKIDTLYRFDYDTFQLTEQYLEIPERIQTYYGLTGSSYNYCNNSYLTSEEKEEIDEDPVYADYLTRKSALVKADLLSEAAYETEDAISLGHYYLEQYKARYKELEAAELADTITTEEQTELYEFDDTIFYLKMAIDALEKEVYEKQLDALFPLKKIPTNQVPIPYGH